MNFHIVRNFLFVIVLFGLSGLSVAQSGESQRRVQIGDTVQVQVLGEDELTVDIPVNETGVFIYPLLGEIALLGKTIVDIQSMIANGLRGDFLINPQVNVNVIPVEESEEIAEELPEGVYIYGEVRRNGQYRFQDDLTISKAIVLAGGFTNRAARNRVTVVSNDSEDQTPARVKLDYVLQPGDIVNVPRRFF